MNGRVGPRTWTMEFARHSPDSRVTRSAESRSPRRPGQARLGVVCSSAPAGLRRGGPHCHPAHDWV
jgi:hypothetical protein